MKRFFEIRIFDSIATLRMTWNVNLKFEIHVCWPGKSQKLFTFIYFVIIFINIKS